MSVSLDNNHSLKLNFYDENPENVSTQKKEARKFKCEICSNGFFARGKLEQHVTVVHEGKKPFKCEMCDFTSGHKSYI